MLAVAHVCVNDGRSGPASPAGAPAPWPLLGGAPVSEDWGGTGLLRSSADWARTARLRFFCRSMKVIVQESSPEVPDFSDITEHVLNENPSLSRW